MNKHYRAIVALLTFTLLFSCKKDFREGSSFYPDIVLTGNFFAMQEGTDSLLVPIIADIKAQNDLNKFVPAFVDRNGMPAWNKAVINDKIAFIPFIKDQMVHSFLTVNKKDNKYYYRVYDKNELDYKSSTFHTAVIAFFGYFEKQINNKPIIAYLGRRIHNTHLVDLQVSTAAHRGISITSICFTNCGPVDDGGGGDDGDDGGWSTFFGDGMHVAAQTNYGDSIKKLKHIDWDTSKIVRAERSAKQPDAVESDPTVDPSIVVTSCSQSCSILVVDGGSGWGSGTSGDGSNSGESPTSGTGAGSSGSGSGSNPYGSVPPGTGPGHPGITGENKWYNRIFAMYSTQTVDDYTAVLASLPDDVNGAPVTTQEQRDWLLANPDILHELAEFAREDFSSERTMVIKMVLQTKGDVDAPVVDMINDLMVDQQPCCWTPIFVNPALYMSNMQLEAALMKEEHPDWGKLHIYAEVNLDLIHDCLQGAGLFPVVGDVCDLLDGALYAIKGDGVNAGLSLSAAVPFLGWGTEAVRIAKKVVVSTVGVKTALKWVKVGDIIKFSGRDQLRKVLGMVAGDLRIAHHIIPVNFSEHVIVQRAAQIVEVAGKENHSFHINELANGFPIDKLAHSGNHADYIERIRKILDNEFIKNPNITPTECRTVLDNLMNKIREQLIAHPEVNVDNLIF